MEAKARIEELKVQAFDPLHTTHWLNYQVQQIFEYLEAVEKERDQLNAQLEHRN